MPARPPKTKKTRLTKAEEVPALYIAEGGATIPVSYVGPAEEHPAEVHVNLLDIAALGQFILLLGKDRELAAFVCDMSPQWAARLHPLSVQLIKQKAMELNFTSAQIWAENNIEIMAANQEAEKRLEGLASKSTSKT